MEPLQLQLPQQQMIPQQVAVVGPPPPPPVQVSLSCTMGTANNSILSQSSSHPFAVPGLLF